MTDSFRRHSRSLTAPPEHGTAVVPDDARDLAEVTRALYVGGAGDLAVVMADGTRLVFGACRPARSCRSGSRGCSRPAPARPGWSVSGDPVARPRRRRGLRRRAAPAGNRRTRLVHDADFRKPRLPRRRRSRLRRSRNHRGRRGAGGARGRARADGDGLRRRRRRRRALAADARGRAAGARGGAGGGAGAGARRQRPRRRAGDARSGRLDRQPGADARDPSGCATGRRSPGRPGSSTGRARPTTRPGSRPASPRPTPAAAPPPRPRGWRSGARPRRRSVVSRTGCSCTAPPRRRSRRPPPSPATASSSRWRAAARASTRGPGGSACRPTRCGPPRR